MKWSDAFQALSAGPGPYTEKLTKVSLSLNINMHLEVVCTALPAPTHPQQKETQQKEGYLSLFTGSVSPSTLCPANYSLSQEEGIRGLDA